MTARIRKVDGGHAVQLGLNPANMVCKPVESTGPGKRKVAYGVRTWATAEAARAWAYDKGMRVERWVSGRL